MLSLPAHVHMLLLSNSPCLYLTPMIHNHSSLLALATTIHHSGMVLSLFKYKKTLLPNPCQTGSFKSETQSHPGSISPRSPTEKMGI